MKRLLLIDEDPRQRLLLTAFLSPHYQVEGPGPGEDPLKAARVIRPDLALLSLHRHRPDAALKLCRLLKTDLSPVRWVGIYGSGSGPPPEEVLGPWMADGYLGGPPNAPRLLQFLEAMGRGDQPCISPPPPPSGWLRQWVHRLTG